MKPDDPAAGGLLDDVLEALAHHVLKGHALTDDISPCPPSNRSAPRA
jgi:hypothetical protein